ncbi:MAG: sulfatase-like hydrolase/transferase [Pigmentiphaga sp.]|nr:sulfatase-like hydrolase/transferase [Pigmentiphaga sp.]
MNMKVRSVLTIAVSSVGTLLAQEHPNILWLTYEDTSPHFIGSYGNDAAKTPNMDALAANDNGLRFQYAYSNGTVSSPSRSCLITGMDVEVLGTGNHRMNRSVPSWVKGFPYYLKQAGYYTSNNSKTDYNIKNSGFVKDAWNESSNQAHWRKRPSGNTPFFSVFNIGYSHASYASVKSFDAYLNDIYNVMDSEYKSSESQVVIPPFYYHDEEMTELMTRVQNCVNFTDQTIGERLAELRNDGLDDNTIVFVFSDHGEGMPRAKGSAIGMGYRVPFIVWFPDKWKHLNPFDSKVITDRQIGFEDLAPTILKLAGVTPPDYMKGKAFLGENPQETRTYIHGSRNRLDDSPGIERSVFKGKYVYTRVFTPYLPFVKIQAYTYDCGIQQHTRKHQFYGNLNDIQLEPYLPRQIEYLYDLESDPWEIDNLADDPACASLLKELRDEMIRYIVEVKDIGFIPEYEMQRRATGTTPYDVRESDYDIENILETALLVGQGVEVLETQISLLNDSDPLIRYWAAAGIYNQGYQAVSFQSEIQAALGRESFEAARIELAAFLYKFCDVESGADIIKAYAMSNDELLANVAICRIQDFDERITDFEDFVLGAKEKWGDEGDTYTAAPAANVTYKVIQEKLNIPFTEVPQNGDVYYIKNNKTKGYLAVENANSTGSQTLQTYSPNTNAKWKFKQEGQHAYLQTENGNYTLVIPDGKQGNNVRAQLQTYSANSEQQWTLKPFEYGYCLINNSSQKALQVNGQGTDEGRVISQYPWNGKPHFVWQFINVNPPPLATHMLYDSKKSNLLEVYPNPAYANTILCVRFVLYEPTDFIISMFDINGKQIAAENFPNYIPGEYVVNFSLHSTPIMPGNYVISLTTSRYKQNNPQVKLISVY